MLRRALSLLALVSCGPSSSPLDGSVTPPETVLTLPWGTLTARGDGTLTLRDARGRTRLRGARPDVLRGDSPRPVEVAPSRCVTALVAASEAPREALAPYPDAAPSLLRWRCEPVRDLGFELYVHPHATRLAWTTRLLLTAHANVTVLRSAPLALGAGGALFLDGPVTDDRVLDNGSLLFADFTVRLHSGSRAPEALGRALPIPLRGAVAANNNLGLLDQTSGRGMAAGFLGAATGLPVVSLGASSLADGAGYDTFAGEVAHLPTGKPLTAGATLWSELFHVELDAPDGITALERYADAVQAHHHLTPWHERVPGRRVPSAWQSWTLGYTGGYGSNVDQRIVRENVAFAARELAPWGFAITPIDDGWQRDRGDWTAHPTRFPDGLDAEVSFARDRGLGAGFWVSPFSLNATSETARTHPEWLAALDPALGPLIVPQSARVLDLSVPEALDRVREVARRLASTGQRWSKQDFAYYVLGTRPRDRAMTSVEAFRRGWAAVRAETSPDTLLLAVAIFGPNYGVADAIRTGLDTGGRWDENRNDTESPIGATRSFKTTARTATRRWYFNDRVALLDPDALPFRAQDNPATIGPRESNTLAVLFAMLGGVVELGDPLVSLTPASLATVRRILPPYGRAARPLDVFVRDYNERWVLAVRPWSDAPDAPAPWTLAAVTHWGVNRDHTGDASRVMQDVARRYRFARDELRTEAPSVAWELFSNTLVPVDASGLEVSVEPHAAAVVIVRARRDGVQLLGTDRHVTGGAPDVITERWDAVSRTFTLALRVVAPGAGGVPSPLRVALRADVGVTGSPEVSVEGAAVERVTVRREGELVTVEMVPVSSGEASARVRFGM